MTKVFVGEGEFAVSVRSGRREVGVRGQAGAERRRGEVVKVGRGRNQSRTGGGWRRRAAACGAGES